MNVPPSKKAKLIVCTEDKETFKAGAAFLQRLAFASEVTVADSCSSDGAVCVVTSSASLYMPLSDLIDFKAELARLQKELEKAEGDKQFAEKKLNNPGFVAKAPEQVISAQREQLAKTLEKIEMLQNSMNDLKKQM